MYLIQAALPLSILFMLVHFSPAYHDTSLLLAAMVIVMSLRSVAYGSDMRKFQVTTQLEGEKHD